MLAQLKMEIDGDHLDYKMSSNLQGVLYETIDPEYVEELHRNRLHPYSQCLIQENGQTFWIIKTISQTSYEKVILPLQNYSFQSFALKNGSCNLRIRKKEMVMESREDLYREFCECEGSRYLSVEFQTPTAFRQNNRNIIYPDLRLIFQSLMNKYSASSDTIQMFDEETLEQLTECTEIVQYSLRSISFPMEGVKIPGFKGKIRIRFQGSDTMSRYARMLFRFGEYSGIGIKAAMGMGAIRIIERGN